MIAFLDNGGGSGGSRASAPKRCGVAGRTDMAIEVNRRYLIREIRVIPTYIANHMKKQHEFATRAIRALHHVG
jgi:hypothetical protein